MKRSEKWNYYFDLIHRRYAHCIRRSNRKHFTFECTSHKAATVVSSFIFENYIDRKLGMGMEVFQNKVGLWK